MSDVQCLVEESEDQTSCRLRISGSLNVCNAVSLHQVILATCEKYPQMTILLENVEAFDVTALQILAAAKRFPSCQVRLEAWSETECVGHWVRVGGFVHDFPELAA